MWLFTPNGFYSVGSKRKGTVTVRARNRQDIEALRRFFPRMKPRHDPKGDYEWRITVPKRKWAEAVYQMAMEIDGPKFKDEVERNQGYERYSLYLRIWSLLLEISDKPWRWGIRDRVTGRGWWEDEQDTGYVGWTPEDEAA